MMEQNKNKILVVVAHPDDEVLGCGGTIAKYANEGNIIYCLFLGKGKASRFSNKNSLKIKKEQTVLTKEAKKAAEILGITQVFFENFPDQRYDTVPILTIIKAIRRIKEKIKPNIIFTHHFGDLNRDHRITFQATLTVCRPLKKETVKKIYSFEVPSSTEWGGPERKNYFVPNVFVDVSDTFNRKINALKSYKSEIRKFPHPRSLKGVKILAQKRGMEVGLNYAEAFELIRSTKKRL
jgi:LmbE family N-acetylglucosaminyl deacetylase